MANQLSELDLDALERRQTDPNNDPHFDFAMMTKAQAIDLIHRLREAESGLQFAAQDSSRLNVALDAAVRFNGSKNRIIEALEDRVALLERVLRDVRSWTATATPTTILDQADAALAVRLTDNASSSKAGKAE